MPLRRRPVGPGDLAADGNLPQAKIRQRLHRIDDERTTLSHQLAET